MSWVSIVKNLAEKSQKENEQHEKNQKEKDAVISETMINNKKELKDEMNTLDEETRQFYNYIKTKSQIDALETHNFDRFHKSIRIFVHNIRRFEFMKNYLHKIINYCKLKDKYSVLICFDHNEDQNKSINVVSFGNNANFVGNMKLNVYNDELCYESWGCDKMEVL